MSIVLIIEDEPDYQKILKDTFEKDQFEVILASDGKVGIIEALKNKPDFILLDLMMPKMNGTEVLRHIKDFRELSKIPIAILSAVPDGVPQSMDKEESFKNIVAFWVKDEHSPEEIVKKVKAYLKL